MSFCCPTGYTYNPVTGECEQITSTLATLIGSPVPVISSAANFTCSSYYGNLGAVFYADITALAKPITASTNSVNFPAPVNFNNYAVLLDGSLANLPIQTTVPATASNYTWGFPLTTAPTLFQCTAGRLNIAGIWTNNTSLREWIGIKKCITIPQTKTYYIGIAGDDVAKLSINNQLVLDLQGAGWNFNTWKVFPITLNAGNNTFLLEGLSTGGAPNIAYEIYDATLAQLVAVPNATALAPYILFSSLSLVGEIFTNGTTIGYSCSPGCVVNNCTKPVTCDCITTVPAAPCCYTLTNCVTGAAINTRTDISIYVGKVVKIDDTLDCWIVSPSDVACAGATPVTVLSEFIDCVACVKKCYKLIDCSGDNTDLLVENDLSAYVGKVIKIESCPDICWTVVEAADCVGSKTIVLTDSFDTCNICLEIFNPTIVLKNRSVLPNYGNSQGNCSIEYINKVNCNFAEQTYSRIIAKKYGIKSCEEPEYSKWWIKKQLLDLNLIEDPNACIIPAVVPECVVPVEPTPPVPESCPAPTNVTATFSYIVDCVPPTNVTATFSFDHPVGNP